SCFRPNQRAGEGGIARGLGAIERAVDLAVDLDFDGHLTQRGVVALWESELNGQRLSVAVGVAAQVAQVRRPREQQAGDYQTRPDVVEHLSGEIGVSARRSTVPVGARTAQGSCSRAPRTTGGFYESPRLAGP